MGYKSISWAFNNENKKVILLDINHFFPNINSAPDQYWLITT